MERAYWYSLGSFDWRCQRCSNWTMVLSLLSNASPRGSESGSAVRYRRPGEAAAASSDRDGYFGSRIPSGPEATKSSGVLTLSSLPPDIERRLCMRCGVCGGSTPSTTKRCMPGRQVTATRASQSAPGGCACATGPGAVRRRRVVPIVSVIVAKLGHRLRPTAHRCALSTTPQTANPTRELASRRMGVNLPAKRASRAVGTEQLAALHRAQRSRQGPLALHSFLDVLNVRGALSFVALEH